MRRRERGASEQTALQRVGLLAALVAFVLPLVLQPDGLDAAGHRMLGVFLAAIVLWVTEAIPLHATAVAIIGAEILLISDAAVLPVPGGFEAPPFADFYAALANPVLMLFLGGFFLAEGAAKYSLDRNLARVLLKPFGTSPRGIMLGLMLITAVLSMFMSNTATTATMTAVVLSVTATLPPGDRLRTGLALSIPIAANVGGIATPVGTPPNAIALGGLAEAGITITFLEWMLATLPFMLLTLAAAWVLLGRLHRSPTKSISLSIEGKFETSRPALIFYVTFIVTVGLWLTEPLHGVNSQVVGFFPVVVLLATRVFGVPEIQNVRWDVLWLVGGGIALATGMSAAGVDAWIVGLVEWEVLPTAGLLVVLALIALGLSTTISNSATANLLVPIGLTMAMSDAVAVNPLLAGIIIAVGCSLAMALPISTPPNAIAYATGAVTTRHLAVAGLAVGAIGLVLFLGVAPLLWDLLGIAGM